jgi:hypothetical protein
MRVSVVATGIEARPSATGGATTETAAHKPAPFSMPSFRLRQAPAKPATAAAVTARAATPASAAPGTSADHAPEPRELAATEARDRAAPDERATRPRPEPVGVVKAKEGGASEPGFWHPPLPPQERFQEWGRLRAPVRETDRPPSLFERVTASFARTRERPDDAPGAPPERVEAADRRLVTADEDAYDIPAFLRR